MIDANCPYCGSGQEINHDGGYGYDDSETYSQDCVDCGKTFAFTTYFIIGHETHKADCLNGAEHKYEPTRTYPVEYTKMECASCGETRKPTKEEMNSIMEARDKQ